MLDWKDLPVALDTEARLSRLTAWLIAAEKARTDYVLTMPELTTTPAHGPAQRTLCLRALATHVGDAA